jgi:hypothetical protein
MIAEAYIPVGPPVSCVFPVGIEERNCGCFHVNNMPVTVNNTVINQVQWLIIMNEFLDGFPGTFKVFWDQEVKGDFPRISSGRYPRIS